MTTAKRTAVLTACAIALSLSVAGHANAGFLGGLIDAVTAPDVIISDPSDKPEVQDEVDYLGRDAKAETDYLNRDAQAEIDYYNSFNQ